MAAARRFAYYPPAKEASGIDYTFAEDTNPPLRGLPLAIASSLVTSFSFLPRLLFNNAGFGAIKLIPGLGQLPWRLQPLVIPLGDGGDAAPAPLEFGPDVVRRQAEELAGRFLSAADYHALYKAKELTPVQVVEALLSLVSDRTVSDHAIAWIEVHADEVRAAAKASADRWAAGSQLGILDGVPIGVKADTSVKGYVNTNGMKPDKRFPFLTKPAEETTWCVRKLEEAGAIVIGKMAMHEIGMDISGCNPNVGTPVNWYNKTYFPGGSSSGPGSAIGGGLVPIAVGTDAGGSLRVPATYNGIYGLKPTFGRIPYGDSSACVVGPMAATAADLRIAYRLMAQQDLTHPFSRQFASSQVPGGSSPRYIGVCRPWVDRSAPTVKTAFDAVLNYLTSKQGYEAVDIQLPYLQDGQRALSIVCLTEAVELAKARIEDPKQWLTPINHPNRILLGVGQQTSAQDYIKFSQLRELIMRHLAHLYERYPGLLVLTPTTPEVGWPMHPGDQKYGFTDGNASIRNMSYVWLANLAGCPAVSCPMGYADPRQGEGKVPIGLMAMGEWGAEEQLLSFAADAERHLNEELAGGRLRPKEWVDVVALARKTQQQGQTASAKDTKAATNGS